MKMLFKSILIVCLILFSVQPAIAQDSEKELFLVAQRAFEDGFYDVASRYINQYIQKYPQGYKSIEAKLLLGQCYYFQEKYVKAYSIFQELLPYRKYKDAVLFWIGETYFKGKDYTKAAEYYRQVIKDFPNSLYVAQSYYSLGWVFFQQKKFQESHDEFVQLVNQFPKHHLKEDALFKMGECLIQLQNYDGAIEVFQRYAQDLSRSPRLSEAYYQLGELFYYQKSYQDARNYYRKAEDLGLDPKFIVLSQIGQGWAHLKDGQYDEAIHAFQRAESQALARNIFLNETLLGQASVYIEQKRYQEALNVYTRLIDYDQDKAPLEALLGRANVYYYLENYEKAIEDYSLVIEAAQAKKDVQIVLEKAAFGLAWTHLKQGTMDEAIAMFEKIIDSAENRHAKISAMTQIGDAYQDVEQYQKAIDVYDRLLKDYADNPSMDYVQFQQGVALLKMEKLEAAQLSLQTLKRNFPDSRYVPEAQYYLAVGYFQKEDWAATKELMEEIIESVEQRTENVRFFPEAYYVLALSYFNLEKHGQAQDLFQKIIQEFKENVNFVLNSELNWARSLMKEGKGKEGVKRLKKLVKKYSGSSAAAEGLQQLGEYYFQLEQNDEAKIYFEQIIADYGASLPWYLAHYYLGKISEYSNAVQQALGFYEISKQANDEDVRGKSEIAIANIFSNDQSFEQALAKYEEIIEKNFAYRRDAYVSLARLYGKNKQFDQQVKMYQHAKEASKGASKILDVELQFYLADSYEQNNQLDQAIEEYLRIPYIHQQDSLWVVRSYLRVARLFEHQEMWDQAKAVYEKIILLNSAESKYAQERIRWIEENI